ncbi:MAG: AmmeMemoRadiSam system protein A [Syntrophomonadaceae bacterium]|nr:AmmeMemoRadiSam system protein A [Syntrophomonadaceae bacterium]
MNRMENSAGRPGKLLLVGLAPHPPIMVPEVGRGREQEVSASLRAMARLGGEVAAADPEVIVVITPHGPLFQDAVALAGTPELKGDLGQFGAPRVSFAFPNDLELVELLAKEAEAEGIATVTMTEARARRFSVGTSLDHGVMVPLYFVRQAYRRAEKPMHCRLAAVTYGLLTLEELYRFGIALQRAVEKAGRRAALIASGDLSHRLTADAPSGYHPEGAVFDREIARITAEADVLGLFSLSPQLCERAGECGLRSFTVAWGAMDGCRAEPEVYSYEGPFGVGYLVANLGIGGPDRSRRLLAAIREQLDRAIRGVREKESAPVRLARETVESYLRRGKRPHLPPEVAAELRQPAGVFVSIKKRGQLRGCIGTIAPTQPSAAEEIIQNAVSAAFNDPRFPEVDAGELDELEYSVDLLGRPEPIESIDQLDPRRYGVIVSQGDRRGLLLPDLEGIDTPEEQVAIARRKAGIAPGEPVKLERFEVIRYK